MRQGKAKVCACVLLTIQFEKLARMQVQMWPLCGVGAPQIAFTYKEFSQKAFTSCFHKLLSLIVFAYSFHCLFSHVAFAHSFLQFDVTYKRFHRLLSQVGCTVCFH